MEATFWYFTFRVTDEETGYDKTDHAVAASDNDNFPLDLVITASKEELGESAKVVVLSTTKISASDYKLYCEEIGVD